MFLDSHCEATDGWYEPMAYHIKTNPKAVTIPLIDTIDYTTLEFRNINKGNDVAIGGFMWNGMFAWKYSKGGSTRRIVDPVASPTMAGGLFAMRRDYYWELGGYDDGMIGWGGENLEISFRVWQCHGRMDVSMPNHFCIQ